MEERGKGGRHKWKRKGKGRDKWKREGKRDTNGKVRGKGGETNGTEKERGRDRMLQELCALTVLRMVLSVGCLIRQRKNERVGE